MPGSPGPHVEWVNDVAVTDGVAVLDLNRASHFEIDQPDGDFEIQVANVPAGPFVVELVLLITFGVAVPTVTWPAAFSGHPTSFDASGSYTIHMRTWDAGAAWTPAASAAEQSVGAAAKWEGFLGDGSSTEFPVTHLLNTLFPNVTVYDTLSPGTAAGAWEIGHYEPVDANSGVFKFSEIPGEDQMFARLSP